MKRTIIILLSFILFCCLQQGYAAGKKTFLRGFTIDNVAESKKNSAEKIFTSTLLDAGYSLITMESLGVSLSMEELKTAIGSNDEKSLKDIMAASNVDYIVYGAIRSKGGYTFITVKMLDKSHGSVELGRIRTLRIKKEIEHSCFEDACRVLADFVVTGNQKPVQKYQDILFSKEKRYEKEKRSRALHREEIEDEECFRDSVAQYKSKRRRDIAGKYSILRFGYNFFGAETKDENFDEYFKRGTQVFFELDVPLNRRSLSGLDYILRYTYRYFAPDGSVAPADPEYADYWDMETAAFFAFDFGLRYRLGLYALMTKFDLYAMLSMRYMDDDFNLLYGCGFEMAFFPSFGFFIEYNYGYSDIGESSLDIENHQFLIGLAYRI